MYFYKSNDIKSKNLCSNPPSFNINGKVVETVSNFKYLGVMLDSNLSFKMHIDIVENKMNCALRRFYSLHRLMSEDVLKIFFIFVCLLYFGLLSGDLECTDRTRIM